MTRLATSISGRSRSLAFTYARAAFHPAPSWGRIGGLVLLVGGLTVACSDDDPGELGGRRSGPETATNVPECATNSETPMRRLTRLEVRNTIADVLGVEPPPLNALPEDTDTGRFRTTVGQDLTPPEVEKYLDVAEAAATRVIAAHKLSCTGSDEKACIGHFLDETGTRLFRRPLSAEENAHYAELFARTRGTGTFDEAAATLVGALLVAPQFLFHLEPRPSGADEGKPYVLDDFQIAARLSYTFWHTTPDAELLDLARAGKLRDVAVATAQANRLMDDERARAVVRDFLSQWLAIDRIGALVIDRSQAPEMTPELVADFARESQAFAENAFWSSDDTLKGLLASPTRFRNQRLSAFYGDKVGQGDAVSLVTAPPETKNFGLFSQAGFMAVISRSPSRQIIYRGRFVREKFLCGTLSPPGAGLPIAPLPDVHPGTTTRQQVADHTSAPVCMGCHARMNPLGYALENFDSLGRWRDKEGELPIDAKSDIGDLGTVNGAFELAQKLADDPGVRTCVSRQIFEYTLARNPGSSDACSFEALQKEPSRKFRDLFVAIAQNPAFFTRQEPTK